MLMSQSTCMCCAWEQINVPLVMDVVLKNIMQLFLQVCSIEQELNYLQKLNHENLVQYISMKYVQEKGSLIIYVLQVCQLQLHTCLCALCYYTSQC